MTAAPTGRAVTTATGDGQVVDGGLVAHDARRPDGDLVAPAGFVLLGDDAGPGCVGDACAIPGGSPTD